MARPLVIVESPAKARTIRGFLGDGYVVEASVGHIRDLPESASAVPEEVKKRLKGKPWASYGVDIEADFAPVYVVPDDKKDQVSKLKAHLKDASELLLATDEDREGESISWHLREVLKPKVPVKRLVFHEITPEAIREALRNPRSIDEDLVSAQETRRIVDRLYGYSVSPLLWKKVRPKLSAGRVQSVAVRLIVDRERARMAFHASTWWGIDAALGSAKGSLAAALAEVDGRRIATGRDFDETTGALQAKDVVLLDEAAARSLSARLEGRTGRVVKVETRPYRDKPAPPFTTSTLQQEANRKLRWTAKHTMKVAQTLYENGWITYMRTDSVALSDQAIGAARDLIARQYGADYLPSAPRKYKSNAKNAQEAHEAIRPAGATFRTLDESRQGLDGDQAKLYELIWKRTVACQMADAEGDLLSMAADVALDGGGTARFAASGKTIRFPGFRRAYVEGSDDPDAELADQEKLLPPLVVGDAVRADAITPKGHTTQPPARLTEATLVKELEARGIGRPSTYAEIIGKIIERDYVFKKGNALVPTFTAFAVTGLLERHLSELVDYEFTAKIEDELDGIAMGKSGRVDTLRRFYLGDHGLQRRLGDADATIDPREVCTVPIGKHDGNDVVVRIGRYGPFLSEADRTADVPDDTAPEDATLAWAIARLDGKSQGPRVLGTDPHGTSVLLMDGRFGPYVQLGEATNGDKPPRASLLPGMKAENVDLTTALALLSLPRSLGDSGSGEVTAANGRFGPYVRRGTDTRTVPAPLSVLTLTLAEAEALFAQPARRGRAGVEPLAALGVDPASGGEVKVMKGRFGPYVTDGTTNATLPKGMAPENCTLQEAAELLAKRRESGPPAKGKGRRSAPTLTSRVKKGGKTVKAAAEPGATPARTPKATPAAQGSSKAAERAPASARATGATASAAKAATAKAATAKAATAKTATAKAATAKTATAKAAGATTSAAKTTAAKPPSTKATGAKTTGTKATGAKTTGTKATGAKTTGAKATGAKTTGAKATGKGTPKAPPPKHPPPMPKFETVKYRPTQPEPAKPVKSAAPAAPAAPSRSPGRR